jgi:hypothetical protein
MSYKPSEQDLIAYLYNEVEGEEREKIEQYLLQNPEAKREFEKLQGVSSILGSIKDKEVIAPPIFLGDARSSRLWETPYFRTIMSVAASLILVILIGKFAGISMTASNNEFRLSFGPAPTTISPVAQVSETDVQTMINQSLQANNKMLHADWEQSQQALAQSISKNMVVSSDKMNEVVRQASTASKEEIQNYVSSLQAENMKLVKDYFTLTSGEQKQYIEGLLVDFAKYLQQQRNDDLQLVQLRLNNLEQNTSVFKQETEQILTSIISSVGTVPNERKY